MARGRSWLPTKHNENVLKTESVRLPLVCSSRLANEGKQIWGRLKIVQGLSCLNSTLCRFSICFSFIVSSEKEGLALGSSSQHSFIILYLSQRKNYAWYVEQQFFRSIPIYSSFPSYLNGLMQSETKCEVIRCCCYWPVERSTRQHPFMWLLSTFKSDLKSSFFLESRIMVNTAILMPTFICLLFNYLFICLKSEIFTYCLECGVKRLG